MTESSRRRKSRPATPAGSGLQKRPQCRLWLHANGWLLLGIGKSTFVALKQAAQQIVDTGRPAPANTEQDLTLELTLLSQLPALQNLLSEKSQRRPAHVPVAKR